MAANPGPNTGCDTLNCSQVSGNNSIQLLCANNPTRRRVQITQTSTTAVYLGGYALATTLSASNGDYLAGVAGTVKIYNHTGPIYGFASSSFEVSVAEECDTGSDE